MGLRDHWGSSDNTSKWIYRWPQSSRGKRARRERPEGEAADNKKRIKSDLMSAEHMWSEARSIVRDFSKQRPNVADTARLAMGKRVESCASLN